MASQPDLSTDIELGNDLYAAATSAELKVRLKIRNEAAEPVTLTFPTGQIYDLEIRDGDGNVVYLWSRGRTFAQAVARVEIQFEKEFPINAPLAHLHAGRYVVQAWLALEGPPRVYSGSARFEVK